VALRPRLWSGLPFSPVKFSAWGDGCQFEDLRKASNSDNDWCNVRFGSVAAIFAQDPWAEAFERLLEWHDSLPIDFYWYLGVAWLVSGKPDKALENLEQGPHSSRQLGRMLALHDLGRHRDPASPS